MNACHAHQCKVVGMCTNQLFLCVAAFFLAVVGCQQAGVTVDVEKERQALLAIYETEKSAHRNTDVEFVYAGIMLYEKHDGKWLRVANVSTFE